MMAKSTRAGLVGLRSARIGSSRIAALWLAKGAGLRVGKGMAMAMGGTAGGRNEVCKSSFLGGGDLGHFDNYAFVFYF